MIASYGVVKTTNKSVKAMGFQQIKEARIRTRAFRSALKGKK